MSDAEEGTTVTVTSKGQATIPKEFRDKLHIETPGRVRFSENEEGEIVVRPVKRPSEIRGALKSGADEEDKLPSEMLREERDEDTQNMQEEYELSEPDE
ncbi:AbrB/MazE/SpoVT family DNA-binding domain-containing protein [Saliphagus sp. LR7]|uniref:AbrB/MazE/SpoVT family DNA-binding domain-containing protein n=1 Tax=Saliphagus sp. LR7 TaxID=2282654 RepID=UPI000DF76623|nr:AbrB/MazE/SpoVT family DNA-binding domain-containing protein [Saliphagus sp. LR7]